MNSKQQFILFERVEYLDAHEHSEFIEDGNYKYPPEEAYYLHYTLFTIKEEDTKETLIKKKSNVKIDDEIDPDNLAKKTPIEFCKQHNDAQLSVLVEQYKKIIKEHTSYIYESKTTAPEVKYYEDLLAIFRKWYRDNKIELPAFDNIDEYLRQTTQQSSHIGKQHHLIEKSTKDKKSKRTLPYNEKLLIKEFLKIVKEENDYWPKLKTLKEKSKKSTSTWSRRLTNQEFLKELCTTIQEQLDSNDSTLLEKTLLEAVTRKHKQTNKASKDIYSKGSRTSYDDSHKLDDTADLE